MKALILNSGLGHRMGKLTTDKPKCLIEISEKETILSRQLRLLLDVGITEVVMTTGYQEEVLVQYCRNLNLPIDITFITNPLYRETNYIYSIYCARKQLDDDIILMHGDLVFEYSVLKDICNFPDSCVKVSSTISLPKKDFKAVVKNGRVEKIGIEFFDDALEAQALYKLNRSVWEVWLNEIIRFCENGEKNCYAEKALNDILGDVHLCVFDCMNRLCKEIDNSDDLVIVKSRLEEIEKRTVYMCFSADMLHSGHIDIIKKAQKYGKLIIGVLSDNAVASYKNFPLISYKNRKTIYENIAGVYKVVEQRTLSYKENLEKYRPHYVVHGDDWQIGIQKHIRDEVTDILATYGGQLIEFPYARDITFKQITAKARAELSTPDVRRARLKKLLSMKGLINAMESHNGLTGLIVENTVVEEAGGARQFDAMWISSLCDSTAKGKPDIELVDMSSRFRTIDDICEVTTKPIIFDGDTGGLPEHFAYTVRTLERMGVSMVIIEDKIGLKRNSLFGTEVAQTQDSIEHFSEKIRIGKKAQKTDDFMICARIESLILEAGMEDALKRAEAFVTAGADAIMIHSRKKEPDEIYEFVKKFRTTNQDVPLVVVPTSFNSITEEEFKAIGVNIVIYANHFTRTGFPAMQNAAKLILKNHRAKECDEVCMPFKEIIRLIPEE